MVYVALLVVSLGATLSLCSALMPSSPLLRSSRSSVTRRSASVLESFPLLLGELAPYEKEGVPTWAVAVSVGLVFVTLVIPVLSRKKQLATNSRRLSPEEMAELDRLEGKK